MKKVKSHRAPRQQYFIHRASLLICCPGESPPRLPGRVAGTLGPGSVARALDVIFGIYTKIAASWSVAILAQGVYVCSEDPSLHAHRFQLRPAGLGRLLG